MKNIFLKVRVMLIIWPLIIFTSDTEVTWTGLGGETSMTGQTSGDQAGTSIAMNSDGTMIVVGEPYFQVSGFPKGRARTYILENNIWTEFGGATAMVGNGFINDQAGYSVAMNSDGSIVIVGEPQWNSQGRVRTYSLNNGVWTEFGGAMSMTGQNANDQAGYSVATDSNGSIVAVGEIGWSGGAGDDAGRVRTYILQGGTWMETGGSITGENSSDFVGRSIAISSDGTIIAVGEDGWDGVGGSLNGSGRVRTYSLQGGVWTEFGGETSMTGQIETSRAGYSVAINSDGTIVAVGELGWSGYRGRVRTYSLQGDVWTEFGGETSMTGQNAGDEAGYSIKFSSDGTIIAVGEDRWNMSQGRVRTYSLQNGVWTEFGGETSMTGDFASTDLVGSSVALSSYGTIIAVGARGWSGNRGRVRAYFYPSTNDKQTEDLIRNSEIAHTCYSDISQGTYTDHQTNPGGVGQGAWFTPYRITVQGR